jgi:hypothetical protein
MLLICREIILEQPVFNFNNCRYIKEKVDKQAYIFIGNTFTCYILEYNRIIKLKRIN